MLVFILMCVCALVRLFVLVFQNSMRKLTCVCMNINIAVDVSLDLRISISYEDC